MILACRRQICHSRKLTLLSRSRTRYIGANEKIADHYFIQKEAFHPGPLRW